MLGNKTERTSNTKRRELMYMMLKDIPKECDQINIRHMYADTEHVRVNPSNIIPSAESVIALPLPLAFTTGDPTPLRLSCLLTILIIRPVVHLYCVPWV
jgi:hypothetical protein